MNDKEWFYGVVSGEHEERAPFRKLGFILFAALVLAILFSGKAFAQAPLHVLERDGVTINLMAGPCIDLTSTAMIASSNLAGKLAEFRAIDSTWLMKDGTRQDFAGCWLELTKEQTGGEEGFLVLFSDRTFDVVAKSEFRKAKGQTGI